jgi:hypothetical protein
MLVKYSADESEGDTGLADPRVPQEFHLDGVDLAGGGWTPGGRGRPGRRPTPTVLPAATHQEWLVKGLWVHIDYYVINICRRFKC